MERTNERPAPRPADWRTTWTKRRGEVAALLLILALAAGIRLWRINELPPGLHYDEAFNTLYGLRIYRGEVRPIFIPENNGEEPLHMYLIAALFMLTGPFAAGGRVVSALAGVVTVLFVYGLALELYRGQGRSAAVRIGLLSSLALAIWYWPVHYSRVGMEPALVPMVSAAAVYFVWRAIRTRALGSAVVAGVFTAIGLYTYPAGRAIPLLVFLVAIYHAIFVRDLDRKLIVNFWVGAAVSALVALPIAVYFLQHPFMFMQRVQQTTAATLGTANPALALWQGLQATGLGLFWQGDQNWRQNLPGRPVFDGIQLVLAAAGAAFSLRRLRFTPHGFILAWCVVGFLPTILTEYAPHFGRALGAVPPLSLLLGYGLWSTVQWIRLRLTVLPGRAQVATAGLGLALAFTAGRTLDDYFNRWGRSPELYASFDVGLREIGDYVAGLPVDQPAYLSPVPSTWYTLVYALNDRPERLHSFNGRECLVLPETARNTTHEIVILRPGEDERSLARLQSLFPTGYIAHRFNNAEALYAVDFVIPAGTQADIRPAIPARATFGHQIRLFGYDIQPRRPRPGDHLRLRIWWSALTTPLRDYTVFLHLFGPPRHNAAPDVWAQHDSRPCDQSYLTRAWQPGDVIVDDYQLTLPANAPGGVYHLDIGFYELSSSLRLPVRMADRPYDNSSLTLTDLTVQ